MKQHRHQRGQIMLIILGSLFLGGGAVTGAFATGRSVKSLRMEVRQLDIGASRRDEVLRLVDRWEAISGPAVRDFEDYGQALLALLRERQASPAEFRDLMERQRQSTRRAEDRLLPLRDELRAALTRSEWDRLFRPSGAGGP